MAFTVSYNIKAIDEFSKTLKKIQKNFKSFNENFQSGFSNVNNNANKASKSFDNINKKTKKTADNLNSMSKNIKTTSLSKFDRMIQNVGNSAATVGGKVKSIFGGKNFKGGFGSMLKIGALSGVAALSGARESQLQQDKLRLSVLVTDQNKLNSAMMNMRKLAIDTNKPMGELTNSFRLLLEQGDNATQAFKKLKLQLDISAYTEIPTTEITRLFTKVQQSGRATNEILDSFNEKGLQLKGILAKMKGMSFKTPFEKQAFDNLVSSGAVTSKNLNTALKIWFKAHQEVTGMAQKMATTGITSNLSRLKNSFLDLTTSMFAALDKIIPITASISKLADIMESASNWFRSFSKSSPATSGILSLVVVFGALRVAIGGTSALLRAMFSLFGGAGIGGVIKSLISSVGRLFIKFTMFDYVVKAFKLIKNAISSLISPIKSIGSFLMRMFSAIGVGISKVVQPIQRIAGSVIKVASPFVADAVAGSLPVVAAIGGALIPRNLGDSTSIGKKTILNRSSYSDMVNNNTYPLSSVMSRPNKESKYNVHIVVESKNADIKSIVTDSKGSSNMNVGINAYRS